MKSNIIIFTMLAVLFTGRFGCDLWTPDEPREAAISLEMSRNGDWVVPMLAGVPFIEKPPLYYIFTSSSIKLAGPYIGNTAAIRLMTALFGLGTLLMTFLLGRLLLSQTAGIISAAMLSVMPGFVETFHWIRVDAALCFFVAAAIWCFAEVYLKKRPWFCLPAGLFCAGAFLSKGLIGPIFIAIPWSALFVLWIKDLHKNGFKKTDLFILPHFLCLIIVLAVSGIWIFLLKKNGGPALWYEWFWVNHVGRLTGGEIAVVKGHIQTRKPFYYLGHLIAYTLPWISLLAVWVWGFFQDIFKYRKLSKEAAFLMVWGLGSMILLSVSATKRPLYMQPVLPVFALMSAAALENMSAHKVIKGYFLFWVGLCAAILATLTCLPLFAPLFSHKLSEPTANFLSHVGIGNLFAATGFALCLVFCLIFKREKLSVGVVIFSTALAYIALFMLPGKAVDLEKGMKADIQGFVAKIPKEKRTHVIACDFSETIQGCFYYYCDWPIVQSGNKEMLRGILEGKDSVFDSIIFNRDQPRPRTIEYMNDFFKVPYRIKEEIYTGGKRGLFWIEGNTSITN